MLRDTSAVLKLNPVQPKAYFRAASALLSLSRWEDALKCIDHGKQLESEKEDSKQAMWQGLEQKAKKGLTASAEKEERIRRAKLGKEALQQAIRVCRMWGNAGSLLTYRSRLEESSRYTPLLRPTTPTRLDSTRTRSLKYL